eukprot:494946_1
MSRKPGMRPRMKRKPGKPCMGRIFHRPPKVLWITPSRTPLQEHYIIITSAISSHGTFGTRAHYQCKRNLDGKIFTIKCIEKSKLYRIHQSKQIRQSLLMGMKAEMDILMRLRHNNLPNIHDQ